MRINNTMAAKSLLKRMPSLASQQIKKISHQDSEILKACTLIPGDGVGPEISDCVMKVFEAARSPITWEECSVTPVSGPGGKWLIPPDTQDSIVRNKVALKGPTLNAQVGIAGRPPPINLMLRKTFDLYAIVRSCVSFEGLRTPYENVNIVAIRENTEGEFGGIEHFVVADAVQNIKITTERACRQVAAYAFEYARQNDRKHITAVHRANVSRKADGLFLRCCREVAALNRDIGFAEMIVEAVCMNVVQNPSQFDVLLLPNMYGDLLSDVCTGFVGGLAITPSGSIGSNGIGLFEAIHDASPALCGQDQANPTALILGGAMMLRHLNYVAHAEKIEKACLQALANTACRTKDIGGEGSCSKFTDEICNRVKDL